MVWSVGEAGDQDEACVEKGGNMCTTSPHLKRCQCTGQEHISMHVVINGQSITKSFQGWTPVKLDGDKSALGHSWFAELWCFAPLTKVSTT